MIPRSQHFRDRAPFPVNWSGVVRIFQEPFFEALLLSAGGRAHYPGKQPNASVKQHHRRDFAARQHIIADRDGFDRPSLEDPFVEALEPAAEDDGPLATRQFSNSRLSQRRAAR